MRRQQIDTLKALTRVNTPPNQNYAVTAYFLVDAPKDPHVPYDPVGMFLPLGCYSTWEAASKYAEHFMKTTGHPHIIASEIRDWRPLTSRISSEPVFVTPKDIDQAQRERAALSSKTLLELHRAQRRNEEERERRQNEINQEIREEKLAENRSDTIEHYTYNCIYASKYYHAVEDLRAELTRAEGLLATHLQALREQYAQQPEMEDRWIPRLTDRLTRRGEVDFLHQIITYHPFVKAQYVPAPVLEPPVVRDIYPEAIVSPLPGIQDLTDLVIPHPVVSTTIDDYPDDPEEEENTRGEDAPTENTRGETLEQTPIEEIPTEETLTEETPIEETPIEETPTEETPTEDSPTEDSPIEETPIEDIPIEETPIEDIPIEDTPIEDTPIEDTPIKETPIEETPIEETPIEETPIEHTPIEETPPEDTPPEETPPEDTPIEDTRPETPVEIEILISDDEIILLDDSSSEEHLQVEPPPVTPEPEPEPIVIKLVAPAKPTAKRGRKTRR